jgi:hypothetical protein
MSEGSGLPVQRYTARSSTTGNAIDVAWQRRQGERTNKQEAQQAKPTCRIFRYFRMSPWPSRNRAFTPSAVHFSLEERQRVRLVRLNLGGVLFLLNHVVEARLDLLGWNGRETEPRTAALQSRNDLADVVADDTEPYVLGVLFNDCKPTVRRSGLAKTKAILRRSAAWAALVIASASSNTISFGPVLKIFLVLANSLICSRTTSMPRSSEAFSCDTYERRATEHAKYLQNHGLVVAAVHFPSDHQHRGCLA